MNFISRFLKKADHGSIKSSSIYTSNSRGENFSKTSASFKSTDDSWALDIAESSIAINSNGQIQFDEDFSFAGMSNISRLYDDEGERTGDESERTDDERKSDAMENHSLEETDVENGLSSDQSGVPRVSGCISGPTQHSRQKDDTSTSQMAGSLSVGDIVRSVDAFKGSSDGSLNCSVKTRCGVLNTTYRKSSTQFKFAFFITCALFCVFFIMLAALLASSSDGGDSAVDRRVVPGMVPSGQVEPTAQPTVQPTASVQAPPVAAPTQHPTTPQVETTLPVITQTENPVAITTIPPTSLLITESPTLPVHSTEKPSAIATKSPTVKATKAPHDPNPTVNVNACIDGTGEFLFSEEVKNCVWLAGSPVAQFIMCKPASPAYSICLETCGNCP